MNTPNPMSLQSLNNKLNTHKFKCLSCKHAWSIESEKSNVNDVFPNFCPNCGAKKSDAKLEWVFNPPTISTVDTQRKANRNATLGAIEMANDYARVTPKEEMVTVKGEPSRFIPSGETQVPKSVVDSLESSIKED
jgi:hypothetical protein